MKSIISLLLTLITMIALYGVGIALVWLGLSYDNGWVIAAGVILCLMLKSHISIGNEKEEE